MDKKTEDAIKKQAVPLAKHYNIADVQRIMSIMEKIVMELGGTWRFRKRFDKAQRDIDLKVDCWQAADELRKALAFLSLDEAKKVFEGNHIFDLNNKAATIGCWFGGWYPFYTHEELLELIGKFTEYLDANKRSILSTGYPEARFESSSWLYRTLACLYPVKIPASIQERRLPARKSPKTAWNNHVRVQRNPILLYTWCEGRKYPGEPFTSRKKCSYEEAPYIGDLVQWNAKRIEIKRPILLNLKTRILGIAYECLSNKTLGRQDYSHFWERCEEAISAVLSEEDMELCDAIEDKYTNVSAFYPIPKNADPENLPTRSVFEGGMEAGGIKSLILPFVSFVERELTLASNHTDKTAIMPLLNNTIPESYYQIVFSPKISKIDKVILESWSEVLYEKRREFAQMFRERLRSSVWNKFKWPVYVSPERYDAVKVYTQFLEKHHKIDIDVTGRFAAPLPYTKEIYPIKLPPETIWEDITIKFLDGHTVNIRAQELNVDANYKEMGFEDKRKRLPNKQWDLLKVLALQKGELTWDKSGANRYVKKKKQLLSDTLKAYFQIEEDPFLPYKPQKAYKIRINLIPD